MPPKGDYDKVALYSSPLAAGETPGLEPVSTLNQGKSRHRLYLLIALVVLVLIGAIVGGVVGGLSRRNHDDSTAIPATTNSPTQTTTGDPTSTSTTASTPTPTATLQFLQPNSKLAVTGWRTNDGFSIRLYYQDRKDNLRFSDYSSGEGSWSGSNKVSTADVMSGTPIGIGTIVSYDPVSLLRLNLFRTSMAQANS